MVRITVDTAELLLDQDFKVLDHGFVRLIDYMGGDRRIVQAARVSYGAGTRSYRQDRDLIHYLMKNEHTSPFEQVVLTFHIKLPIFVARQWVRHRTARLNEISGRYSVLGDEFHLPESEALRAQGKTNKQSRADELLNDETTESIRLEMRRDQKLLYQHYREMVDQGLAREVARINLPLSIYTEWYWQMDLHNLFHFLKLRLHPHAQSEIRQYARVIANCARAVAPIAWEAFEEHILEAVRLSKSECVELANRLEERPSVLRDKTLNDFEAKLETIRASRLSYCAED